MCGPQAIPIIALALSAAGTGAAVIGQRKQQKAANAQAAYAAQVAERNREAALRDSEQADKNAARASDAVKDTLNEGREAQLAHYRRVRRVLAEQRQGFAANNIFVDSDSAMDLQAETQELGDADADTIERNFARQAFSIEQQGLDFQHQARQFRSGATQFGAQAAFNRSNSNISPAIGMATEGLIGGGNILGDYAGFQQSGAFGNKKKSLSVNEFFGQYQ